MSRFSGSSFLTPLLPQMNDARAAQHCLTSRQSLYEYTASGSSPDVQCYSFVMLLRQLTDSLPSS